MVAGVGSDWLQTTDAQSRCLIAGRVRKVYAALAAAIFLAGFLYGFWRVGSSWPGVPPAADGIFHLKQVGHHSIMRAPHLQE